MGGFGNPIVSEVMDLVAKEYLRKIEPRQPDYSDITIYPINGDLTEDGVQYSSVIGTTAPDTSVEIFSYSFNPPHNGPILWSYFLIGVSVSAASSLTASCDWKAQARNRNADWIDLHPWMHYDNIGLTPTFLRMEGYPAIQSNFNSVPLDFRVLIRSDELNEGRGQVQNNTVIRAIYKIDI